MRKQKIERNLVEKLVQDITTERKQYMEITTLNARGERQAYFEKNYKKIK